MSQESKSFLLAKSFLGKEVEIIIDRKMGSKHPKHDIIYQCNYGYLPGVMAPDGEELDAYYINDKPLDKAKGKCLAIIHRLEDDDDKLVVLPGGINLTDQEIEQKVFFQEKFFKHVIIRE